MPQVESGQRVLLSQRRRWAVLGGFALLLHLSVAMMVGLFMSDVEGVRVVGMTPLPQAPVQLTDQPLEVRVRLSEALAPDDFNPLGARLLREVESGRWELVALGSLDEDEPSVVRFDAERIEGRYQVVLASSGAQPVMSEGLALDGEYDGERFPTGDGEAGGDFISTFEVKEVPLMSDVVVAKIVKTSRSAKGASVATAQKEPTPTPAETRATAPEPKETPKTPPRKQRPPKKVEPREPEPDAEPPKKVEFSPQPEVIEEVPLAEPKEPTEASLDDLFAMDPAAVDGVIGASADEAAARLEEERRRGGLLGGWEESWERTQGTLNGDGPKIGYGNQQAAVTHTLEVWEYIAQIHKRVHKQWAQDYLLQLDLMHTSPSSPLNNPNLKTMLELELDRSGEVTDVQMVTSSGVLDYDAEAIRVAWESGPRKQVPESMLSPNGRAYLHWSFWRDQRQCGVFGVSLYILDESGSRQQRSIDRDKIEREEERIGVRGGVAGAEPEPSVPGQVVPVEGDGDAHAGHDHAGSAHPASPGEGVKPASGDAKPSRASGRRSRGQGASGDAGGDEPTREEGTEEDEAEDGPVRTRTVPDEDYERPSYNRVRP